jgi:hypothetical protein
MPDPIKRLDNAKENPKTELLLFKGRGNNIVD